MRKHGLLNPALVGHVARLGHTDTFVVADAGLPIPAMVPVVDLTLVFGVPRFSEVVSALLDEVVVEGAVIASETPDQVRGHLPPDPEEVSHEELKRLVGQASFVVRTGETIPYANVIFRSGVPF
ncbi:D-ribose pyranase [Corynebacterium halotolerans]|uniref:D-ribose pyranase n=1 Tax=Corynebacterium halotolerans TaxID=225326 RepID=UPI003CEB02F4